MAGRTSQATRSRAARQRAAAARRRQLTSSGFGLVGRLFAGLWMAIAHGLGWIVRGIGRQAATARELDPEHRRDGGGLALIGLALLTAVAVWGNSGGPVGHAMSTATRLFLGSIAAALPVLFVVGAVRLMREPAEPEHRGRAVVGWGAIFIGVAGLLDLGFGQPVKVEAMSKAGGLLGRLSGGLLAREVTAWVAVPVLVLLALFGLLVVTATPINKIPQRLAELRDLALGREPEPSTMDDEEVEPEEEPAPRRRPSRRRQAALAEPEPEDAEPEEFHETVVLPKKKPAAPKRPPPDHSPLPTRAEQLALTDADYKLPPPQLLGSGDA